MCAWECVLFFLFVFLFFSRSASIVSPALMVVECVCVEWFEAQALLDAVRLLALLLGSEKVGEFCVIAMN
jgi:hypothetical protein